MHTLPDNVNIPLKIALIYAVVAGLWILFSDELLASLFADPATIIRVSIIKGWLFVILTAVMLYWLIRRYVSEVLQRDKALHNQFTQMTTTGGRRCTPAPIYLGISEYRDRQVVPVHRPGNPLARRQAGQNGNRLRHQRAQGYGTAQG